MRVGWTLFWKPCVCTFVLLYVVVAVSPSSPQTDNRTVCNRVPGAPCLQVTLAGDGTGRVTSNPQGISCPSICVATFRPYEQKITLHATPGSGSKFANWTGGCLPRNVPQCVVSISAATFVTARFDK